MTRTSLAIGATMPRSWGIRKERPDLLLQIVKRRRISAWTVTSGAVVGSWAMMILGLAAMAAAISTRWRMPR